MVALWPDLSRDKYSTLTITILLKQGGGGGAGEGGAKEQGSQGARKLKQNCRLRTVCAVVRHAKHAKQTQNIKSEAELQVSWCIHQG